MKKLKLFFACLLMAVLSIGQVWASNPAVDDVIFKEEFGGNNIQASAYTFTGTTTWSGSTTGLSYASTSTSSLLSNATANPITSDNFFFVKTSASTLTMSGIAIPSNVTEVTVSFQSNKTIVNCTYSFTGGDDYATGATSISGVQTFDIDCTDESTLYLKFTKTGTTSNARIDNVTVTVKAVSGGGSDPSLTVTPTSWDFGEVAVSDEASKVFSVSGSNLTAGTLSISIPEGFSVSPSSISVTEATLAATNVTVSKNTTAIDDYSGNLSISATCGLTEAKTVALEMSVVADPEPTGTFELFSGDIEEGDYVIYYGGGAMNTTVTSNRLQYLSVTPAEDKIVNPDETIIWHIAASGDYWTLYNAAEEKYAASTSAKNQATMAAGDLTNNMKWSITGSATYEFENLARSTGTDSGNKWLRKNGTYGFACYSSTQSGTGPLTLYKKQVAGQPETPAFSIPGGNYETAQSVALSCETEGAKIYYTLDGSKPTSTSTEYSTAIPVSATTTIKAVAIKDNVESTVATATYTIVVWQSVDEIWSSITSEGPTNANVWGYVSQANVGGFNNNYYISVDGSLTANQLEIYKGDNAGNTVAVGDKVHVNGDLTIFNEIKEFKQNTGVIVHYAAKGALQSVAVDGTPTKTEYAANETFDPAGLKVYGTYANGFVGEITDGITWGNDLTDGKVTENTTVHVTATVSGITNDPAYDVPVTVAEKTLVSIAVGTAAYTIYTGEALPQPVVTATFSEGDPEDVSAFAVYDSENVFDTEVIDNPNPQTITVSYTFGGETKTTTYTVSVQDYENADDAPYTVTEALHIITAAIGNTESAREIVVAGTVSEDKVSNFKNRYKISDGANELLVYNGKGFNDEAFTDANYPKVGDVMVVKGKVIYFNNNTPEFASGKSYPLSQIRPATIAIEDVASFEVGAANLAVGDLTITTPSDGLVTLVSSDNTDAVTIVDGKLHAVAEGFANITANLAATENADALNYTAVSTTFKVTVTEPAPLSPWATTYTSNVTISSNENKKVIIGGTEYPAVKANSGQTATITLPLNTATIHLHLVAWNTEAQTVTVTGACFNDPIELEISADAGVKSSGNYTLEGNAYEYYFSLTPDNAVAANEVITITAASGKRFVLFGVNQVGGTLPVLESIEISGTMTNTTGWKTGDNIVPQGLTVAANYTLGGTPQSPVDITEDPALVWSHAALTVGQTEVTLTATFEGKTDDVDVTIDAVETGDPTITTDVNSRSWTVDKDADIPAAKTFAVTLKNITSATITKGGDNPDAFSVTPATLTASGNITVSVVSTETVDTYTATITIKDDASETSKIVNVNLTITAPETPETAVSTTSKWVVATAADLVNGAEVLITGVKDDVTYAMGGQNKNNRAAVAASVDGEDVLTPGENTMSFTLVAQEAEGVFALRTSNGKYLYAAASGDNHMKTQDNVDANAQWTISATSAVAESSSNRNVMQFNGGSSLFSCYNTASQSAIQFYVPQPAPKYSVTYAAGEGSGDAPAAVEYEEGETFTVAAADLFTAPASKEFDKWNDGTNDYAPGDTYTVGKADVVLTAYWKDAAPTPDYGSYERNGLTIGNYATICLPNGGTISGATLFDLDYYDGDNTLYLLEVNGNAMVAGRPYIFLPSATSIEVTYTDNANAPAGSFNGLVGSYEVAYVTIGTGDEANYILYQNAYYLVDGPARVGANRAYIHMASVPTEPTQQSSGAPRRRVAMTVNGKDAAQGFENLQSGDAPVKVMIDGTMYILRGEKVYDATGRLVK